MGTRKIVEIDEELCDGCGMCAIACAEGALEIKGGKARLIKESYCDGLGACLSGCPRGAVRVIEREAEEFDPEEVEEHLERQNPAGPAELKMASGCPSSKIEVFAPQAPSRVKGTGVPANPAGSEGAEISELSHWPVQIRLVPANAPFLKGADLLVVSDCAPVAYPNFHRRFVGGKAVLLGCPKFDDKQDFLKRFTEIFRTADIRSVTVLDMEVPCCSALPAIVRKALGDAGKNIPFEEITITTRGEILDR
ncbi:MAG: 4Fe-4S binding protein [Syntrophobacteraceae bacterium]|nr:4Fe-4S binding protein [Syntrophobacteraceae bacterium]